MNSLLFHRVRAEDFTDAAVSGLFSAANLKQKAQTCNRFAPMGEIKARNYSTKVFHEEVRL